MKRNTFGENSQLELKEQVHLLYSIMPVLFLQTMYVKWPIGTGAISLTHIHNSQFTNQTHAHIHLYTFMYIPTCMYFVCTSVRWAVKPVTERKEDELAHS